MGVTSEIIADRKSTTDEERMALTSFDCQNIWQCSCPPGHSVQEVSKIEKWLCDIDEVAHGLVLDPIKRSAFQGVYRRRLERIGQIQEPPLNACQILSGLKKRQSFYF